MKIKSFGALRFIMITTIFLSHISFIGTTDSALTFFYRYLNNGVYGVTFFFLLSGFCLNIGYSEKLKKLDKDNYLQFIKRRLVKVYSIYIIMQTLYLVMEIVKYPVWEHVKILLVKYVISIPLLQMLFPLKNIQITLNSVSWFLSVLFIIYLLAPVIIMLANSIKDSLKKNLIVTVGLFALFMMFVWYALNYLPPEEKLGYINRSIFMSVIAFTIGVFASNLRLGLDFNKNPKLKMIIFSMLEIGVLLVTFKNFITEPQIASTEDTYFLVKMFVILALIFVFSYDGGFVSKIFSLKIFNLLGDASFEFYLMHYLFIKLLATPLQNLIGTKNTDNLLIVLMLYVGTWIIAIGVVKIRTLYGGYYGRKNHRING